MRGARSTPAMQFIGEAVLIGVASFVIAPAIPAGNRTADGHVSETLLSKVGHWLRGWTDWRLLLIGVVMLGVEPVSVVASVGYFANLAGPPTIGALAGAAGLLNALWLLVAFFLAAFVVAGSLRQQPHTPATASHSRAVTSTFSFTSRHTSRDTSRELKSLYGFEHPRLKR